MKCCSNTSLTLHDPPLIYNLHSDPQELYPLDTDSDEYAYVQEIIDEERQSFEDQLDWNVPQLLVGKDRSIQPCGNPGCSPFPYCCRVNSMLPQSDQSFPWL